MLRTCILSAVALAATTEARADLVAFTDLGNGNSFAGSFDIVRGVNNVAGRLDDGFKFTAVAGGNITTISVAMGLTTGNNTLYLDLYSDKLNYPETLVKGWTFQNQLPVIQQGQQNLPALTTFNVAADNINMVNGQTYWLVAASDPNAAILWFRNDTGATGSEAIRHNGGDFSISFGNVTLDAFQVEVAQANVAPEPSTLVLGGLGALALAGYAWCRRYWRSRC